MRRGSHDRGEGRRMRRGRVPSLLLAALLDGPAHGYELMDRLESSSGGTWRPSPGSVYPLLQSFEDSGLVEASEVQGRRVFALTERGREQALRDRDGEGTESGSGSHGDLHSTSPLRMEMERLKNAARQVTSAGVPPEQMDEAIAAVRNARQTLYRILMDQ
ncbi:PadR family transcriptional regulator [Streptomyces sp. NPDC047081]|uniref:PadR family transcriptional regulator n=1 Tax=Streptomyces sp. NPDC047081 TaxID=3154706 RepID=UPI0033D113D0